MSENHFTFSLIKNKQRNTANQRWVADDVTDNELRWLVKLRPKLSRLSQSLVTIITFIRSFIHSITLLLQRACRFSLAVTRWSRSTELLNARPG